MYCSECGSKYEGNFCPNCGTPSELRRKSGTGGFSVGTQWNNASEMQGAYMHQMHHGGFQEEMVTPKKRGIGYYIKMFIIWYITVAFLLSGVSVFIAGVSYIAAILWFFAGLVLCPLCFKDYSYRKKAVITTVLFLIGVSLMP